MFQSRTIFSFLVSVSLTAAATVLLGVPSVVDAEDPGKEASRLGAAEAIVANAPKNAELMAGESRLGDLTVSAQVIEAEAGQYSIRLDCNNPTEQPLAGDIHVELGRNDSFPMARVEPPPKIVWRKDVSVKVGPGQSLVRELKLPTQFSKEMARLAQQRRAAETNPNVVVPPTSFSALAYPRVPDSPESSSPRLLAQDRRTANVLPMAAGRAPGVRADNDFGY